MTENTIPLVSIRCTVYNHEPYLRQCLDGFVMQRTNFPFEAIVHDDCSTDGSAAIIREYAEKYPDIIKPVYETENQYSKHDGSLVRVMDAAMHPESKYVAICEGDDYWTDPDKLQLQVDFLESHPDYTMCFHRANTIIDETGEDAQVYPADNFRVIESRDYDSTELFDEWIVPTASMLFRKECQFYQLKRPRNAPYGDIYRVLSCAAMGKVHGMDRMMSVYRIQRHGITFSPDAQYKFTMYAPEHYDCIRVNFPKVDRKLIKHKIAQKYWERASIRPSKMKMLQDVMKSFRYDCKVPLGGIMRRIGLSR